MAKDLERIGSISLGYVASRYALRRCELCDSIRLLPAVAASDLPAPERAVATGDRRAALRQAFHQSERPR